MGKDEIFYWRNFNKSGNEKVGRVNGPFILFENLPLDTSV